MGHATIEWVYVGVVIALLTWVGAESWNVERLVEHVPAEAETIKVIGQQWFWTFEHEDGKKETGQLHVKQGVPYKFEIVSKDVIHDFNVPDYTILMDAVPGRVNVVWNLFDEPGEFPIQCREYCGFGHSTMRGKLFVEPQTVEAAEKPAQGQNATTAPAPAPAPLQLKVKMLLQLKVKMLLQLKVKMLLQLKVKMLLQLKVKMLLQLRVKMLLQLKHPLQQVHLEPP